MKKGIDHNSKVIRIKGTTEQALKALRTREHETLDTVIWRLILEAQPDLVKAIQSGAKVRGKARAESEGLIDD